MLKNEKWILSFGVLLAGLIYYPSLKGFPIWDDAPEWFLNPLIEQSYSHIFSSYAWPGFIAFQRFLISVFGYDFRLYHGLSLLVHLLNSLLTYGILRELKASYRLPVFFLFLFHPANVIAVSWMIQIKTLLCFFFSALGIYLYLNLGRMGSGRSALGLGYFISLLFKSASLPLPAVAILKFERFFTRRNILIGGVLVLIGIAFVFRLFASGLVSELGAGIFPDGLISPRVRALLRIIRYYFFQSIIPFNTIPVKDLDLSRNFLFDVFVTAGIYLTIVKGAKELYARALLAGLLMMVPFLSIIPAPFMNHTWVGDHHLYLALPLFLTFFFLVPVKKEILRTISAGVLLVFYLWKIHTSIPYYKNDVSFYSAILEEYPASVSMAINLSGHYAATGKFPEAIKVIENLEARAKKDPRVRKNRYFKEIIPFKQSLIQN